MQDHEAAPLLTKEQQEEAERRELAEAVGRQFAEAHQPNPIWGYLGIVIYLPALILLAFTWDKEGASIGRYGYHPAGIPVFLIFISILLIRKGLGKGD